MKIYFVLLALIPFASASAQEAVMEQLVAGEKFKVQLVWPEVYPDKLYDIEINFVRSDEGVLRLDEEVSFTVQVIPHEFPLVGQ